MGTLILSGFGTQPQASALGFVTGSSLEQPLGSDRCYQLSLFGPGGTAVSGFQASDPIQGKLWAGEDQAPLASPAAQWINPAQGTIQLTVAAADTAGLAPGSYRLQVGVTAGVQTLVVFDGTIRLTAAPGSATPRPVYCSFEDLKVYAPWIGQLHDAEEEQTGFAEERGRAREWLDDLILRNFRGGSSSVFGSDYGGGWGARRTGLYSPYLIQQLQQNRLIVRPAVVEAVAKYAIGLVCQAQLGRGGLSDYARFAYVFRSEAQTSALCLSCEIDTNGDGIGDLAIPLGSTNTLWS